MATANKVREYAKTTFIEPAKRLGLKTIVITAREIHDGLGLKHRFPLVCSSLDAVKFLDYGSVKLVRRNGPKQSSTVYWNFEILG